MKIGIIAAISLMVLLIFWVFMVLPSKRKINAMKEELSGVQNQIRQIEEIFSIDGKMEKGIRTLKARYKFVNSKFPSKEEEALGKLSDIAKRYKTEIYSVSSQPKEFVLDENGRNLEVEGKICQKILISMKLRASYRDFIEYIDALKEMLPSYITVESLTIQKDASGPLKLNINLSLTLYLLAQK